jgi:hypothetical protein
LSRCSGVFARNAAASSESVFLPSCFLNLHLRYFAKSAVSGTNAADTAAATVSCLLSA